LLVVPYDSDFNLHLHGFLCVSMSLFYFTIILHAGCDAKTTEYKFFKKLWEQSGCRPHSFSKQNEEKQMESHNVMPGRKLPAQKSTFSSEETPATPCKNEEIYHEQVNAKASHSG
jgi:hypothetical protein